MHAPSALLHCKNEQFKHRAFNRTLGAPRRCCAAAGKGDIGLSFADSSTSVNDMSQNTLLSTLRRVLGLRTRAQEITYQELMDLTDLQLEDIGLTRGLIETVVLQGPQRDRKSTRLNSSP